MTTRIHNTNVVDLSRKPRGVYPAQAPVRQFVSPQATFPAKRVRRTHSLFARLVTLLLIPELLCAPVLRAYADEIAPPLPTEVVEVAPPVAEIEESTPVPVVENTPEVEVVLPENPVESTIEQEVIPVTEEAPTSPPVLSETPPLEDSTVLPTSVLSDPISPQEEHMDANPNIDTLPVLPEGDAPSSPPDDTVVVSDSSDPGVTPAELPIEDGVATTTQESISPLTESTETNLATSTEESLLPSPSSEESLTEGDDGFTPPTEEAPSEVLPVGEDEGAKIARIKEELRREVEAEFMRGCITFEESGYYCLNQANQEGKGGVVERNIVSVQSEAVSGSDKEIVVTRNGERVVLTQNDWEDAFPSKDMGGEAFVWQGMKSGRWQIFMGTVPLRGAPTVTQVTDSRESNFNPKIDGHHLVWQGWVDGNWEIFLATARASSSPFLDEHLPPDNAIVNVGFEWGVTRLTHNLDHDMFPSLHGDIVTWQSREGTAWVVYAHSITSGRTTKLSGGGVKSERPQFSITWEEEDSEGRTRLLGYDLTTGETTDLSRMALALPTLPSRPTPTPVSEPDPIALPAPASSSSTPKEGEDIDNDLLP